MQRLKSGNRARVQWSCSWRSLRVMQTPTFLGCIPSQEMQLLKQHQLRHWVTLTKAEAEIASSQTCSSPPNTSTLDTQVPLSFHIFPSSGGIQLSLSTVYPEIKMKKLPCNSSSTDLQGNKGLLMGQLVTCTACLLPGSPWFSVLFQRSAPGPYPMLLSTSLINF